MGGGSSTPSNTASIQYIRYAPYIEARHEDFLNTVYTYRQTVIGDSPFSGIPDIEVDDAFFGVGFSVSSFPSLYDMYGKFMAGMDIEALWNQTYEGTVNGPVVQDLINAESALMDDELQSTAIPRMQTGMRDVNSVITSSFAIGKSLLEDTKQKLLSKFSADLKFRLIPVAVDRWKVHLEWNKNVIGVYAEIIKFYYSAKTDIEEINRSTAVKNKLWPFTVLDYERAAIGVLQGATVSKTDVAGASTAQKIIGGALSGAAMGAMIGNTISPATQATAATGSTASTAASAGGAGWGAGIGAVLGIAAAYTY